MNKLNGWQRLYVIFVALSAVVAGCFAYGLEPNYAEEAYYFNQSLSEARRFLSVAESNDPRDAELRAALLALSTVAQRKQVVANMVAEHDEKITALKENRSGRFGLVALVWLGVCLAFYGTGWTVAWVIRGFRHKSPLAS